MSIVPRRTIHQEDRSPLSCLSFEDLNWNRELLQYTHLRSCYMAWQKPFVPALKKTSKIYHRTLRVRRLCLIKVCRQKNHLRRFIADIIRLSKSLFESRSSG